MDRALQQDPDYQRLVAHLLSHRDDDAAWSVLGDLLLSHGHPRGELAALDRELSHATSGTPRHRELLSQRRALFVAHRDLLLGPDAVLGDLVLTWRAGFVQRAQVPNGYLHPDCVKALRTHSSGVLLEELETSAAGLRAYFAKPDAPLTHLVLRGATAWRDERVTLTEAPSTAVADDEGLGGFSRQLPGLISFTLAQGANVAVDGLRPPRLERLEVVQHAAVHGLRGLLRHRRVPSLILQDVGLLEELDESNAPECLILEARLGAHALDLIIAAVRRSAVRTLNLEHCEVGSEEVTRLAGALQGSLRNLDLRLSPALRRHPRLKAVLQARKRARG